MRCDGNAEDETPHKPTRTQNTNIHTYTIYIHSSVIETFGRHGTRVKSTCETRLLQIILDDIRPPPRVIYALRVRPESFVSHNAVVFT